MSYGQIDKKNAKRAMRSVVAGLGVLIMAVTGLVAAAPAAPADALTGSQFNPNLIITDANFFDAYAMTQPEIQSFLEANEPSCSNSNCLRNLTMPTADQAEYYSDSSGKVECQPYIGVPTGELASTIIFKVQQICGISAKVILVTLQKEQGLITSKGSSDGVLNRAMGMGCPDSSNGACMARYAGFFNQVYWGARQYRTYKASPQSFTYKAGKSQNIAYSPNTKDCPTAAWVYIFNAATAALYNYTPYVPNGAALANLRGLAVGTANDVTCASYGNRNFWVYYNDWFGSPTNIALPQTVSVTRIGGDDRFDTAVNMSMSEFATASHPVVYIANGLDFPDALSAGPAAAVQGGVLLLVRPTSVPTAVAVELQRLAPSKIVVVGGTSAVSESTLTELAQFAPVDQTMRVDGVDRYASSANVARSAFAASGADVAYVATGAGFADALSASAAAGAQKAPVILVDGLATTLTPETKALITSLRVKTIKIAGGPASVSPALEAALRTLPGVTVTRFGGDTRYTTSLLINRDAFKNSNDAYVASGMQFPDALSGAAVAGAQKTPLYLVQATCLYQNMLQDLVANGTTSMTILGGSGVIGAGVASWVNCS